MIRKTNILIIIISLFIFLAVSLSGCGPDEVQDDMLNYLNNELPKIAAAEEKISSMYDGTQESKDEQMLLKELNDKIIPKYRDFVGQLESIIPDTPEVKELHEIYIKSSKAQLSAFIQMTEAVEKNDPALASAANEKMSEAREALRDFESKAKQIAGEHNIELE